MVLLALLSFPAFAADWKSIHDDGNVRVQQRPYKNSPLQEIRGEVQVQASLAAVVALLKDADYNRHWVYRSGGAQILQMDDDRQAYVYGIVDAPWPMQDRDTVVRFDYTQDPDTQAVTISITNVPDFLPEKPGLVRVPDIGGFWRLRPVGGAAGGGEAQSS